jgi:hypothetical protein
MHVNGIGSVHSGNFGKRISHDPFILERICNETSSTGGKVILHCDETKDEKLAGLMRAAEEWYANLTVVGDSKDMSAALEKIRDEQEVDQTLMAYIGGDGSQSLNSTQIVKVWGDNLPLISLLGGGTMNTGKGNLGIKGKDPLKNLENLCMGVLSNLKPQTTPLRLLKVKHDNEIKYGCLFGMGLAVSFLEVYYNRACIPKPNDDARVNDKKSNPIYGAILVAKCIVSAALSAVTGGSRGKYAQYLTRTQHLDIEYNGIKIEDNFGGLLCGTIPDVGFGFNILPQDLYGTDQFQMLAVTKDMSKLYYLTNFLRFRSGEPALQGLSSSSPLLSEQQLNERQFYFDESTDCLKITFLQPPMTGQKSQVQLDGEIIPVNGNYVEVTLGPQLEVFTGFNP